MNRCRGEKRSSTARSRRERRQSRRHLLSAVPVLCLCVGVFAGLLVRMGTVEARDFHEPPTVPARLKGTPPHHPRVIPYYLRNFVNQGDMTEAEATATRTYMIYRFYRRRGDLRAVAGMAQEQRRAYMRARRQERGNALLEYSRFTGIPLRRAAVLVDLFHHNDMGARQYEKWQQEKPRQGEMNV